MDKVRTRDNQGFFEAVGRDNGHYINLGFILIYYQTGFMWIRWMGYKVGFKVKNIKKHELLFSERNAKLKIHIGPWYVFKLRALFKPVK